MCFFGVLPWRFKAVACDCELACSSDCHRGAPSGLRKVLRPMMGPFPKGMVFFLMLWVSPLMLPTCFYANGFCSYANRAFPYAHRAFPYAHLAFPDAPPPPPATSLPKPGFSLCSPVASCTTIVFSIMLPRPPSFPPKVGLPCSRIALQS